MASYYPSLPDLSQQPLTVDFIDNRLDKYHSGFATPPAKHDPHTGAYFTYPPQSLPLQLSGHSFAMNAAPTASLTTPNAELGQIGGATDDGSLPPRPLAQPASAMQFWDSLFPLAMEQLREAHPEEPDNLVGSKHDYRIRNKRDWDGVYEQLEHAKTNYCNVTRGFIGKARNIYRKLGQTVAQPVMTATKLAPDIDIVTPVLGAVQILLEAAKNAAKVREDIVGGFDDIDKMFSQVELFLEIYERDETIERASVTLISTVFYAIECVIGFFISSTWKRAGKSIFEGQNYQKTIAESLRAIRDKSQNLIAEADSSEKYENRKGMQEVLRRTQHSNSELAHVRHGLGRLESDVQQAKTAFHFLIGECIAIRNAVTRSSSPAPSYNTGYPQQWYIDPPNLLSWIDIPDLTSEDLEYIEERRRILVPAHERARAEQLIQVGRVKQWIASPTSCQLLVHGNYESKRVVSGLSLFCTSLFLSLAEKAPQIIRLAFFCGLHTDSSTDEFTGGRTIIASFIYQLLCQFNFEGSVPGDEIVRELVERWDLQELCRLFEWLVNLLPKHIVVFCLIDGILYYEREEFVEDMGYILVTILRISNDELTKAALKILITSPTKTLDVRKPFPDELIVSMDAVTVPSSIPSTSRLERALEEGLDEF